MKKTLVALAVLAASGASFAQVTITGEYAYGFQADKSTAGAETSGFGVDTSLVTFTATEDLGGGLKATAVMNLDGFSRGTATGGDSSITLDGGFGKVKLGLEKGSDYLSSVIGGIAGLDGKVFGARTVNDSVAYTTPAFGAVTFGLSHTENTSAQALGTGSAGNNDQRSNTVTANYAAGALSLTGGLTSYDNQDTDTNKPNNNKSRARIKGSYDFGSFKLGAGFLQQQKNKGTYSESIVAATLPLGNLSLGAALGTSKRDGSATAAEDISKSGYSLAAVYSLSKRTSLQAQYKNWDDGSAGSSRGTQTWLAIDHTF